MHLRYNYLTSVLSCIRNQLNWRVDLVRICLWVLYRKIRFLLKIVLINCVSRKTCTKARTEQFEKWNSYQLADWIRENVEKRKQIIGFRILVHIVTFSLLLRITQHMNGLYKNYLLVRTNTTYWMWWHAVYCNCLNHIF